MEYVPKTTILPFLDTREQRHRGRIVKAPDQFMFLGEMVSDEHDLDPSNYNKAISDNDVKNWQSAVKVEKE